MMALKQGVLLFASLFIAIGHGQDDPVPSQPSILTPSGGTYVSVVGGIVSLTCRVDNLGSDKLNWVFVKHSTTIFHGTESMVDDPRYTLVHPPESNMYSLQIIFAKEWDQGIYKCEVDSTKEAITLNLELTGAPVSPDLNATREPLNHTSCCRRLGVSEGCQPACFPSTAGNTSYVQACASDLSKLIQCGADGRNHEDCCARSNVSAGCLLFCSNDQEGMSSIGPDHLACLGHIDAIISCYEYGGALLPSVPQSFSVISVAREGIYSLQVTWKPPLYNPSAVSGYRVHYKQSTQADFRTTGHLNAATDKYSLPVQVNTAYSVYVVALGHHGSSQPTDTIDIVVEDTSEGNDTDVLACCERRNVPPNCQTVLCHPRVWSHFNVYSTIGCYVYLTDVFSCLVGERDHWACCALNNVPEECGGMCRGHPPPYNSSLNSCIPKLSVIQACVQSGLSYQPRAPQGLMLKMVEAHSAVVEWAVPSSDNTSAPVPSYYVQLRRGSENASWTNVAQVSGRYLLLTNLTETENYAVRVIALTANSSSLPSAIIRFTTYPELQEPEQPTVAHNITQCCVDSGMPAVCSAGCQYQAGMTEYFASNLAICMNHIGTVLTCAADGRNHTRCCERRRVQEVCLSLCAYNNPGSLEFTFLSCVADTGSIIECYEEGLVDLVGMPEDVEVSNLTSHSITLKWKNPDSSPRPQLYLVISTNLNNNAKEQIKTTQLMYILQNLVPGTQYQMTVSSILNDTSSPPTNPITAFTPVLDSNFPFDSHTPTNISRALWTNRTHCCQSSQISLPCQAVCQNRPATNATHCTSENFNILACAANGQDHSQCCKINGLPEECLPLCSGRTMANFSVQQSSCLADARLSTITSCFLDNSDLLPSAPYSFTVRNMQGSRVIAEWSGSSNCATVSDPCSYDLHYWSASGTDPSVYTTKYNVTSPTSVSALVPDQFYTFTVTARNSYGSGAPSPWVTLFFGRMAPEVYVVQSPKPAVHEQGTTVNLTCATFNLQGAPSFTWRLRDRVLNTRGRVLMLPAVSNITEGNYNCTVASEGRDLVSAASYVNVRFMPVFSYFRTDSVRPYLGEEAVLACWFRGHPNTSNPRGVWSKDGQPIPVSSRHSTTVTSRYHTGITAFKLKVAQLVPSDYGKYQCKVSNQYGSASAFTKLIDPAKMPPPITPTQPQIKNVSSCCRARGVIATCLPLCSMEVSASEAIANPDKYGVCLFFFSDLIECAADGADHTLCCQDKVVAHACLPFCKGQVPSVGSIYNSPLLLSCVPETPTILDCMDRGYDKIPTAPRNVLASFVGNRIKVAWEPPSRNPHRVTSYNIYYNSTGNSVSQRETVTTLLHYSHVLENTNDNHEYYIWMTADSYKFGSSQISNVAHTYAHGKRPLAPRNVKVESVKGTSVTVSWEPPAGGVEAEAYGVYYRRLNTIRAEKKLTMEKRATLTGLKEDTEYEVYVASRSIEGEGPNSTAVKFTTGQKGDTPSAKKQTGDSGLGAGQVAGIVLAVVVVITVIVLIAVLLFRSSRNRVQKKKMKSVTFQNSSYGNEGIQINDLPSTSAQGSALEPETQPEEGSFSYTRLKEDSMPGEGTLPRPARHSDPSPAAHSSAVRVDVDTNGVTNLEDPDLKSDSTT